MKTNKYFEDERLPADVFAKFLPKGQEWFSPKETGAIIGRSDQYVRNTFYSGKIFGHLSNGLAKKGMEKKTYLRVHRSAILLYLAQSANYTSDDIHEALMQVISRLSDYQLMRLEKSIRDLISPAAPRLKTRAIN